MQNFTTSAQVELGDAFGLSPASCEWIAESIMTGPVAAVPSESAVTDRLIREICYLESRVAFGREFGQMQELGFSYAEAAEAAARARTAQYTRTSAEVEAKAKELGLL